MSIRNALLAEILAAVEGGGGGAPVWGTITGDIINQTDLIAYVDQRITELAAPAKIEQPAATITGTNYYRLLSTGVYTAPDAADVFNQAEPYRLTVKNASGGVVEMDAEVGETFYVTGNNASTKIIMQDGESFEFIATSNTTWDVYNSYIDAQAVAATLQPLDEKGQPNGYAPLDGDSLVPRANLPTLGDEFSFILSSTSTDTQLSTVKGTPFTINYGAGAATADATLDAGGVLTFHTAGQYDIYLTLTLGRTLAPGDSIVFVQSIITQGGPDIELGNPVFSVLQTNTDTNGKFIRVIQTFSVGDTFRVDCLLDAASTSGNDQGGVISLSPGNGWQPAASASLDLHKFVPQ